MRFLLILTKITQKAGVLDLNLMNIIEPISGPKALSFREEVLWVFEISTIEILVIKWAIIWLNLHMGEKVDINTPWRSRRTPLI